MNKKIGLGTKKEIKFFTEMILKAVGIKGFLRTILNWFLPGIINTIDDNYGDKIPEPWQTHLEVLVTKTYIILQDGKVSIEEQKDFANYCAAIIDAHLTIKGMPKSHKIQGVMILTQYAASQIKYLVDKKIAIRG